MLSAEAMTFPAILYLTSVTEFTSTASIPIFPSSEVFFTAGLSVTAVSAAPTAVSEAVSFPAETVL